MTTTPASRVGESAPGAETTTRDAPAKTIQVLLGEKLKTWSDEQIRMWCYAAPLLLLAPPQVGLDLDDYPREKGPPTSDDWEKFADWTVVKQMSGDTFRWFTFARWCRSRLFPEFVRRFNKAHANAERVVWLEQAALSSTTPQEIPVSEITAPAPESADQSHTREKVDVEALRRRNGIIRLNGKEYVTHAGLLQLAHDAGLHSIEAAVVYSDHGGNHYIVKAVAVGDRGTYTAHGDASPQNTKLKTATLRMAETRAISRALRLYLGIGMTSAEELPGRRAEGEDEDDQAPPAAALAPQRQTSGEEHPSWHADSTKFPLAVEKLGINFKDLVAFGRAYNKPTPQEMDRAGREELYQWLKRDGKNTVKSWLEGQRGAAA